MKTNKIYRDALMLSMTEGTSTSLQNKWLKIEMTTDDPKLKYLAGSLRVLHSYVIRSRGSYTKPIIFEGHEIWSNNQTYPLLREKQTQLRNYVESVLATEQPEWQIIALNHGWSPPVK